MTREDFKRLATEGLVLLDGATGTNLQKMGLVNGVCPDEWILSNPEAILSLQEGYLEAGSRILYSPTFSCNRVKLAEYGLEGRIGELNEKLVGLSKKAVARFEEKHPGAGKAYVAGDVSMTGIQVKPVGPMDFEELVEIYREQIGFLAAAGADLIVVETMMSLQECRAALIAAKECCSLPVMVTMTFEENGRSLFGTDIRTALVTLEALGADAFGANCSTGPDRMKRLLDEILPIAGIPLICKPNAGMPRLDPEGNTVYDMDAREFAEHMGGIIRSGVRFVGGCCGTDAGFIAKLKENYVNFAEIDINPAKTKEDCLFISSERETVKICKDSPFRVVGERINPTGKKKLQAELRAGSLEMVREFARSQEEGGASVLDINMGLSGVDEAELMVRAIEAVTQETSLPLCIDSSYPEVLEKALRIYPGRALLNSISAESAHLKEKLRIAKKYGAAFILLPMGDEGLPKDFGEKKKNMETVLSEALQMGFARHDIIVDGLVGAVGALKTAGTDTLDTIRFCREEGLFTICGLSNISFGLPERIHVNAAFLSMAIREGLNLAICNPNQPELKAAYLSADLLMNRPGADLRYIEYMNEHGGELKITGEGKSRNAPEGAPAAKEPLTGLGLLKDAVVRGKKEIIGGLTEEALKNREEAGKILNEALIPGINEVGALFDEGRYFLPQLIASAEAMELSISLLEPYLQSGGQSEKAGTVVIATVEGDVHDIGKNLVSLMLKNYGFRVIDLGKNVPGETIVDTAVKVQADIICLSALMTTTMKEMKQVIALAKERGCRALFMIGGAVITEEYQKEIGADGYAQDAAEAVRVAKRLMKQVR